MASVSDTLLTVLSVQGAPALNTALAEGAVGFSAYAQAEGVAAAAGAVLEGVMVSLTGPLALVAAAVAVVTGGFLLAGKALSAFSESEATTARLALQMKNLGNVFPTGQLLEFSNRLQDLTGINHNVIAGLGATAAQFGLQKSQIEKLLPTVLDISAARGLDPDQVLNRLLRASRGRPQGLVALGIDPSRLKGDLKDVDNLISQVGKGFSGVAEGLRHTLPQTVNALHSSMGRLFEAIGRFISPVVVPLLNLMIQGVDKLTTVLNRLANFLHLPTAADLGGGEAGAGISYKGDPEQTGYLKEISAHTAQMEDAFVKSVLGGAGTIARQAFTARDARIAFGI